MKKLNEIEVYLLEHWEDIASLEEAIGNLEKKTAQSLEEVVSALKRKEWWSEEFQIKYYPAPTERYKPEEIYIFKKSWKVGSGEWDFIGIGIWGLKLGAVLGTDEWKPDAWIWSEKLKAKRDAFNDLFEKYSKEIINSLKISNDPNEYCPLRFELPLTTQDWLQIIKNGKFVEEVVKIFDILAQFIDPIDRALAEVLGKKKGKK